MEKDNFSDENEEIIVEIDEFIINCFFDEIEITVSERNLYQSSLEWMASSFQEFKNTELDLSDKPFILNITICNEARIKELNSEHRDKDKITDVLSFPLQENIQADEYDTFLPEIELGDLFICHGVCTQQAKEFDLNYQEEFIHLSTHGFLHLCGFDHELGLAEEKLMEKWEEHIILRIKALKNLNE
jgi:probable rRNA maturation factor